MSVFVRVTPSRLALDGDDLYRVATSLDSAARSAQSALSNTGGMAGNEDSAQEFIDAYGEGAVNTLDAAGSYAQALRALDTLLGDTANAYTDAGTVGTLETVATRSPSSTPGSAATFSVPSAKAPGAVGPLGEFQEFVMDALAQLGVVLPDADSGKLGEAASAWSAFSTAISDAASELDGTLTNLASMDIPQATDIRAARDSISEKLGEIATGATGLSDLCAEQKKNVDAMWEEIGWFLGQMAAEIALDLGLGALLTVATAGAGAPLVAGKIALTVLNWARKIANLVQKLVALTRMNALAAKVLLKALREGTQSAIATVTVQAAVNVVAPDRAQNLLTVGLGSFAGGAIGGRVGDGGSHVLRIGSRSGATRVAMNTAVGAGEGAVDGLTDGLVQSGVGGVPFDPISSAGLGALIGGGARTIGGGTRPNAPSTGGGSGSSSPSPDGVDVPSSSTPDSPLGPTGVDAPSAPNTNTPAAPQGSGGAPSSSAPAAAGGPNPDAPDAPIVDGAGDATTPVDSSGSVDIPSGDAPTGAGGDTSTSTNGPGVPDVSAPSSDGGTPSLPDSSPSTPDSSSPSMPDSNTPSTPDAPTPSTPDSSAPSTPDTTPSTPDSSAPSTPDASTPSTPDATPSTPDSSAPSTPDSNAPSTPDSSTPSTPDSNAPSTPDSSTPSTPDSSTPSTPDSSTPSTPDTTPSTPDPTAPSTPDSNAPSTPDTTPSTPDATPANGSPSTAPVAGASASPSSPSTSTPDANTSVDSSSFEAAVAADAADASTPDGTTPDGTAPDGTTPDGTTPESDTTGPDDTVDPNALDAGDAAAAGAVTAGAAGVVGLHAGASGGKAPSTPASPASPAAPSSPSSNAPTSNAPSSPTPDANTPAAPGTPDAGTPDANTPETPEGSNSTERTAADIDEALPEINPNFDPHDPANGYATNCGNTSALLNDFLNGSPAREAPTGTLTTPEIEARTGNPQTPMTPDQIADTLRAMGPGSHCVVGIDRSTGFGHWFNAYYDGTTVWSIDAQNATRSPWPPHEPHATTWDASIRPEDVVTPETTAEPDASAEGPGAAEHGPASSEADGSRTGSSETPEAKPAAPEDVTPDHRADVARPADQQPVIGDTDGGPGTWTEMNRGDRGLEDQEWGTGVDRLPNGHPVEYVVSSDSGVIEFDGHQFRGDPPAEVFQEVKGNYDHIYKPFPPGSTVSDKTRTLIEKWVRQAARQNTAVDSAGGQLEWILTRNPELVSQLEDAFIEAGLDIDVRYVPRVS
ncbi:toxin glutamine deamidase domain-containing protein [Labedella endophytica]|uniref:Tox-PL domain-containing protein n=1 Tax=Labedella endophytica TaxID=1523160 RepID=A0A3S0Y0T2_9MICO|nr:toxin glutamine deamidase domain-containing protein [Labedella endophytica]RUR01593.1 hypothetical protein ELQ94_08910 [Labedella endophytica]